MLVNLRRSAIVCVLAMLGTLIYTAVGLGVAQTAFHEQANGSIGPNGSTLIGQNWTSPAFFHGRPDDAGPYVVNATDDRPGGDNPGAANGVAGESGATNLGPRSKTLRSDTTALVAYWHKLGVDPTPDLVTTSGSGYDPDISPADAIAEIPMVAHARQVSSASLRALIACESHRAELGFLGGAYVDVLELNEALGRER